MSNIPRMMIAAPASGSGKSVITSGLMAAFSKRMVVQGYKVGPDYIDPMYHTAATGRVSRNLDSWMLKSGQVMAIFQRAARGSSLAVIEGVMGLFDGYGSDPLVGSSAGIAQLLNTPVILVLDCAKMSGSAAAVVKGFDQFHADIRLAGVICNRVASQRHAQWLREAIETNTSVPVLGCVPKLEALQIPERHLGLFTVPEREEEVRTFLQQAGDLLEEYLDLKQLLMIAMHTPDFPEVILTKPACLSQPIRLAVARDEAFCFYYQDNLDELHRNGAELVPFSPIHDQALPPDISGIYFGGGYPELYAQALSRNTSMRAQVVDCCRQGMPVYAECGGLMYLTEGIHTDGHDCKLVSALPGWSCMTDKLVMGYREVEAVRDNLLCAAGTRLHGHEFHYSSWQVDENSQAVYRIALRADEGAVRAEGYCEGNLMASYVHLHFCQMPQLAQHFIQKCIDWQKHQVKAE